MVKYVSQVNILETNKRSLNNLEIVQVSHKIILLIKSFGQAMMHPFNIDDLSFLRRDQNKSTQKTYQ
jgi:hypothetical protein